MATWARFVRKKPAGHWKFFGTTDHEELTTEWYEAGSADATYEYVIVGPLEDYIVQPEEL